MSIAFWDPARGLAIVGVFPSDGRTDPTYLLERTTDGGATWATVGANATTTISTWRNVAVAPGGLAWAGRTDGGLGQSIDWGGTWTATGTHDTPDVMSFRDSMTGWGGLRTVPGPGYDIVVSTDAGRTWPTHAATSILPCESLASGPTPPPDGTGPSYPAVTAVAVGPGTSGYALCAGEPGSTSMAPDQTLRATTDEGRTWKTLALATGPHGFGVGEVDSIGVAPDGTLWLNGPTMSPELSTDGGQTWRAVSTSCAGAGRATLDMVNAAHGFLIVPANCSPDSNQLAFTSDGGVTWTTSPAALSGPP